MPQGNRLVQIHGNAHGNVIATGDSVRINYQIQQVVSVDGRAAALPAGPGAILRGRKPELLTCNRDAQWGVLDRLLSSRDNCLILVPGPRGEGHGYFLDRIRLQLKSGLPTRIVEVSWRRPPAFPRIKRDYLEALAQALDCDTERLIKTFSQTLENENLIILHPCVWDNFDDDALVSYYTEWLPALLGNQAPCAGLKCVQPIEWRPSGRFVGLVAKLVTLLWSPPSPRVRAVLSQMQARSMISTLEHRLEKQQLALQVCQLPTLSRIKRLELLDFFHSHNMTAADREELVNNILDGAHTSEHIFEAMAKYWS